jgi:hypothetical protein
VYTYHNGGTYGLFSGTLTPTKAGTWTLNASGGSVSVNYDTEITVNAGPPANGTLTPAAVVVYKADSNVIMASGITDAYGNNCSGTYTMTDSYTGTYSGFTASNLTITLSTGSGTAITPSFKQVYGVITYHLGSIQCSFNVWMNPNYTIGSAAIGTCYAIDDSGDVHAWGTNCDGSIGYGPNTVSPISQSTPVLITNISGIVAVSGSDGSSIGAALDNTGHVWAWGNGFPSTPVQVSGLSSVISIGGDYAIDSNGTLWEFSSITSVQCIWNSSRVLSISIGNGSQYFLDSTGHVYAWGDGNLGQLGNGQYNSSSTPCLVPGVSNIVAISAVDNGCLALDSFGDVWTWGNGTALPFRLSGIPSNIIAISGNMGTAGWNANPPYSYGFEMLDSTGNVWNYTFQPFSSPDYTITKIHDLVNIVSINATNPYTEYALDNFGQIWSWGNNPYGQIGNGTMNSYDSPVKVTQSGWTVLMP